MASLRQRLRSAVPLVALGSAAALVLFAPGATIRPADSRPVNDRHLAEATEGSGMTLLEAEIAAMVAAGVPEGDAKLALLRADLAALQDNVGVAPVPEPGVDMSLGDATRDAEEDRADASLWDDGEVPCEPIPPNLLTAAEIAGATCRSEPQADGSSLYIATTPAGTELTVEFHPDGTVTRLP